MNHASVAIGDYIYSFGGYCSGEDYKSYSPMDVHILNTNNFRWSLIPLKKDENGVPLKYPDVPFQRYGHTAVAFEDKVFIWGGRNDEMVCDILFCFDTKTQRWSTPEVYGSLPGARDGHSACIVDHFMYIFGGFEENVDQFSCDVHCLNLLTMEWRYVQTFGSPPSYRDFHSATVINDKMYIFGGRGDIHSPYHSQEEIYCPKIVYLDLKTNHWHMPTVTGKIPLGRRSHSAFVYNKKIYIFGGYNGILEVHFNDLHCFDPIKNVWHLVETKGKPPRARRRQSCLVIGKKMFLFGGTCPLNYNPLVNTRDYTQTVVQLPSLVDYNDTHVLDFEPSLKTLAILAVIRYNLDRRELPRELRWEIRMMITPNMISRPLNNTG